MKCFKILLPAILAVIFLTSQSFAGTMHTGTVIESETGGGYTYMQIEENGNKFWIAGPQTSLGKGDRVSFDEQMWMQNFQSKALDRKFDSIMFVGAIQPGTSASASKIARPKTNKTVKSAVTKKPAGPATLYAIRELFEKKDELNGKLVKVKGRVTKVSSGIMRRTWVHIEDGTTYFGNNKVVFTSPNETAKVGDEIIAVGTLEADKDFGAGYFYSVIVQNSSFSK